MSSKLKDAITDDFFRAILALDNLDECYAFFEDVCTVSEIKSLAQRFQVAKMLNEGKTYIEIFESTKVSTATISRVKRALEYGADGYRTIIDRLKNEGRQNKSN